VIHRVPNQLGQRILDQFFTGGMPFKAPNASGRDTRGCVNVQ
jgi:hypothetical protein